MNAKFLANYHASRRAGRNAMDSWKYAKNLEKIVCASHGANTIIGSTGRRICQDCKQPI
jgi:hypothetical protein